MKPSILVIGSTNTDMVVKADRLPAPGETVLGGDFFMTAGGKGANQAVAAKRLGGDVIFIFKTGSDIFGERSVKAFTEEGIDTRYSATDPEKSSGIALITVDKNAENCIVVASGANASLSPEDITPAISLFSRSPIVLMQLETPLETIYYAAELAVSYNCPLILNPAPACALPASLLEKVSIITPNRKEASVLSGIDITDEQSAILAARLIRNKGVGTVIITLGADGALISSMETEQFVPARVVEAVDTTAAGDVFNGALAVALSEGRSLVDAVEFGCRAAAISVTRLGAQSAAPYRYELT